MPRLPRLAVGPVGDEDGCQAAEWGLMELLESSGNQVQEFLSQSRFFPFDGATTITGQSPRHLDSWLMAPAACREIFHHGMSSADIGVVTGRFRPAHHSAGLGGNLDTLCDWLDLPRVAVIDAAHIDACRLPLRPESVDGLLLDRVRGAEHFFSLQARLEAVWGVPVLGGMPLVPHLRAIMGRMPRGSRPARQLCRELGDALRPYSPLEPLLRLAARRELADVSSRLFRNSSTVAGLRVAVAFDEAFECYFPDTLDLLELNGAEICDFSPLHDEGLPPGVDLVYFGCGHAERLADMLAANHCMLTAMRRHVSAGRRIYAEGSGVAYLCQQMILDDGRALRMAGVLPAVAIHNSDPQPMRPIELSLADDTWLGEAGTQLRGYLNSNWQIHRVGPLVSLAAEPQYQNDLVGAQRVIGSRVHLNLAALPELMHRFFSPHTARPAVAAR